MSTDPEAATHVPDHSGENYQDVLARIHSVLKPRTYLEVGTWTGNSLKHSRARSIAVDPGFKISSDIMSGKPECHLFQSGSDEFFKRHSPRDILGDTVDFAFLDGMHLFEYALRDFINVENNCAANSIVAMHDCLPTDAYIATRTNGSPEQEKLSTKPGWWAGDVWKILPILRKYRPDLVMVCLDAPPTGLVLLTGLHPESHILRDHYNEIVQEFGKIDLLRYGIQRLHSEFAPRATRTLQTLSQFGPTFWL